MDVISLKQKEMLKKIFNLGAGNSAAAWSQFVNTRIELQISDIKILSVEEISELTNDLDGMAIGLCLPFSGDIAGDVMLITEYHQACEWANRLMGRDEGETITLDDMSQSALQEMSNVIVGTYLSSLGDAIGFTLPPSVPNLSIDTFDAIIRILLEDTSHKNVELIVADTIILDEDEPIDGKFLVLLEMGGVKKILDRLENK